MEYQLSSARNESGATLLREPVLTALRLPSGAAGLIYKADGTAVYYIVNSFDFLPIGTVTVKVFNLVDFGNTL